MPLELFGLNLFGAPAIHSEVLAEAPAVHPCETSSLAFHKPDAVDCALDTQNTLLNAGFSPRAAFAGALEALAFERPLVANASGKARRISQKTQRRLRSIAGSIAVEEQGA